MFTSESTIGVKLGNDIKSDDLDKGIGCPKAKEYKNPILTVDGVLVTNGKILLVRRGREPEKGKLALPGGFVEYGERTEEAVVRELKEETGLTTRPIRLLGVYSDPGRDPRGHIITAVYVLAMEGGDLKGGDDAAEAVFLPMDKIPSLAFDHDQIVKDFLGLQERDPDECK
jgi:8-oxo-dGTP diphosphatase